jgi:transcriptional regulator with XRE-family HTH domain
MTRDAGVGRNVARLRKDKRLSQRELAQLAGISRLTLRSIEHGNDSLVSSLERVAEALGVTLADVHPGGVVAK